MRKQEVVIVGGGFGGVKSALELAGHSSFQVTLISDKPFFEYHPLLYHTATGGSKVVSSIPLGEIFSEKRIQILIDTATKLDRTKKSLTLKSGKKLDYDILILGLGNITNYFNIPGMSEYSYGIKSLKDAEKLKAHLHQQLTDTLKLDTDYVIVGGGPTGVELAGALPDYLKYLMKQHGVKSRKIHIDLIEAAPRLMPRMPESVSRVIYRRLIKLGIKIYLNEPVQAETANTLMLDGKPIRTHTVIWTAGIANNPFFAENHFQLSPNGKVLVDRLMQAWPGIFVLGDNADTPYTGMAQTALYDALFVTENLKRHADGKRPYAYKPRKPIYITPAGKHWAVVVWGKLHIYGWLGWALRKVADWIGYKDLEPWWKATDRLFADNRREDNCLICATNVVAID
ncbi:FAD-dependent oxidoreductase [Candidatus Saccharibacteria bacterium]|nr:FAD-dependent oxidoreductase [Candidatus Saccharibacteria bacterium]